MAELAVTIFIALAILLIAAVVGVTVWFMGVACWLGHETVRTIRRGHQ
jgi:hypothetical protein